MCWGQITQAQMPEKFPKSPTGLFEPRDPLPWIDPEAPMIKPCQLDPRHVIYEAIGKTEHWLFYVYINDDGTEQLDGATVFRSQEEGFITDRNITYFLNADDNSETTKRINFGRGIGSIEIDGYNVSKGHRLGHRIYCLYILMRFGSSTAFASRETQRTSVGFFCIRKSRLDINIETT
jgi:hypothetical protein